jgi:biotin operon repressor
MKRLRKDRKETIEAASAKLKEQKKAIKAVKERLKEGGKSVPKLAEETGLSASEILWYIMALKKYGEVIEGDKEGGYYQYALVGGAPEVKEEASELS